MNYLNPTRGANGHTPGPGRALIMTRASAVGRADCAYVDILRKFPQSRSLFGLPAGLAILCCAFNLAPNNPAYVDGLMPERIHNFGENLRIAAPPTAKSLKEHELTSLTLPSAFSGNAVNPADAQIKSLSGGRDAPDGGSAA